MRCLPRHRQPFFAFHKPPLDRRRQPCRLHISALSLCECICRHQAEQRVLGADSSPAARHSRPQTLKSAKQASGEVWLCLTCAILQLGLLQHAFTAVTCRAEQQRQDVHVVLVHPQIAENTGSIARTCAATSVGLHLVGPLGYQLDSARCLAPRTWSLLAG